MELRRVVRSIGDRIADRSDELVDPMGTTDHPENGGITGEAKPRTETDRDGRDGEPNHP